MKKLPLNEQWRFRQVGQNIWYPAEVPGCNFTDLVNAKKISDPFYRNNEEELQWIEKEDWEYIKEFELNTDWLLYSDIELVFDGIDTFCDIYLNEHLLLSSQNMFVGYRVSCKEQLNSGKNLLKLVFHSPIKKTRPLFQKKGLIYPAENDKSEEKLSVYCRKAAYHFGWDWGPRFVTSGIWRDVYLSGIKHARIDNIWYQQISLDDEKACLDFQITLKKEVAFDGHIKLSCDNIQGLTCEADIIKHSDDLPIRVSLIIEKPQRWWPNGLGKAFLYHFKCELFCNNQLIDSQSLDIGLRTIEVINKPDKIGESFYLKVNGHPVFMKGANYIPSDSFLNNTAHHQYQKIFDDAVSANMNMLRVWGGGIYESDKFYQLANQYGILIWQDFMFACSLYPADKDFLDNITQEAEYNIKRLRNHPCLALWCGNNETEMGIAFWKWPEKFGYSEEQFQTLKLDYQRLFKQLLPTILSYLDPQRFYFSSSPIGCWENPEDDARGNAHYWGVWHGEHAFSEFKNRISRFVSEYGFQSFPLKESVKKYSLSKDWHIDSKVMKTHQKHPRGNQLIQKYMKDEFQDPKDFDSFLYLSQIQQALGLKIAFESHRSAMPYCMGSLYWQFNDCWPVASWSSIDYYGKWKALHYQVRRSFQPIAVFISDSKTELSVKIVSDLIVNKKLRLELKLIEFGGHLLWSEEKTVHVEGMNCTVSWKNQIEAFVSKYNKSEIVFIARLYDITNTMTEKHQPISEAFHYFVATKKLNLTSTTLTIDGNMDNHHLVVHMIANQLMRQVYISLPYIENNFSDNFFDLLPNETKTVYLPLPENNDKDWSELSKKLTVISLYDSYFKRI